MVLKREQLRKIECKELDNNLAHYASVIKKDLGKEVSHIEGSGAAGGLGAALLLLGWEN